MDTITLASLLEYFDLKNFLRENSPFRLIIMGSLMCVMFAAAHFFCDFFQSWLEKYVSSRIHPQGDNDKDKIPAGMDFELFEKVVKNSRRVLYLAILYWGLSRLIIGPIYADIVKILFTTLCIWAAIGFFTAFVPFNADLYLRRHGSTLKTSQSRSLLPIIKGIIWAIGLTFLLDNLGFHVSTIIAGLGIVGVAVGLAGQAILADFFNYIVILLDKPFRIGDYVKLEDGKAGDVEYMGAKSTHLRNLEDDLIVCSNSEMTKGVLINYGNHREREVVVQIGVAYDTPVPVLKKMPDILREVVNAFPQCSFDRACLLSFGSSNLLFELMYFVSRQRGGIRDFMNTRSQVNIAILERFNDEGIEMAFPTETVYLNDASATPSTPAAVPSPAGTASAPPKPQAAEDAEKSPVPPTLSGDNARDAATEKPKTPGPAEKK